MSAEENRTTNDPSEPAAQTKPPSRSMSLRRGAVWIIAAVAVGGGALLILRASGVLGGHAEDSVPPLASNNASSSAPPRAVSSAPAGTLTQAAAGPGACVYPETGGPSVPERAEVSLPDGTARIFVRGPLFTQCSGANHLARAQECLLKSGKDPASVRLDSARLNPPNTLVGGFFTLRDGVPFELGSLWCDGDRNNATSPPRAPPAAGSETPKVSFVDAARAALPILRNGHSWYRDTPYSVDLVWPLGQPGLAWIVGRSEMRQEERVVVNALSGAVVAEGAARTPRPTSHFCDMTALADKRHCPNNAPPVCVHIDTGTRCAIPPCPSTRAVFAKNACEACEEPNAIYYTIGPCPPSPTKK